MKSWKLDKEIRKSLLRLIERRRKSACDGEDGKEPAAKDLLGLMIQAANVTVHDIVEECKSFFFAGKQTTSNLLTWTTILLSMHPEWQAKARDEVLRVCGSRDVPTKDHVVKLKTVRFLFLLFTLFSFNFGNIKILITRLKAEFVMTVSVTINHGLFVA